MKKERPQQPQHASSTRRKFLSDLSLLTVGAAAGSLASPLEALAQAKSSKTGVVRVWGEPGPYGGVAVDAMNEWASKSAPGLKFQIETLSWDSVYVKLMTDLAARRPASCISVESPIAMQLMAQGLLEAVDDVVAKVGRNRMIKGAKWEYWGAWKGKQYVLPAHHQPHLLVVRMDVIRELGLGDPDTWDWNDLLKAAKTVSEKRKDLAGITLALGRNLCTDYHFAALLHAAGGRMFDVEKQYEVVFNSPATVETLEFVKELYAYMPKAAVSYSFLEVTDAIVTGKTAMAFYWGRPYGRAFEENKAVFQNLESFNHARHPKTGMRSNWNDFQGWCIPKANNPYIAEVKGALAYYQTSPQWLVRYCHSLMPNVGPVYQDVLDDKALYTHPFFETKRRTIETYYSTSMPHSSSTANELLKGVNPLAGIVHGRAILAETVQKVVLENMKAADAAKWGHAQLEQVRKEHIQLVL
ncbi:MAG: ABC transporter substrate-binding protein [Betaproteobacteria bacterium]